MIRCLGSVASVSGRARGIGVAEEMMPVPIPLTQQRRGVRRTTTTPPWVPAKYRAYGPMLLTPQNREFLEEEEKKVVSPLREEPIGSGEWEKGVKRTGLIVRKIGCFPQWKRDGTRIMTTLLQVLDNHVIGYQDPDTWWKQSTIGKRKAFGELGAFGKLTVGALPLDPNVATAVYLGLFREAGCGPKKRLSSFMVSDDAALQPGTRLFAAHFKVGQFVDVTGRSVDWGFQGVMHRWGFRGSGGKSQGVTKNHRRPGATGTSSDGHVRPGKPLPGHMGWNWCHSRGLKVWRINHELQVLYVTGQAIPGETGEILQVKDCFIPGKRVIEPPFPTYYPDPASPLPTEELDPELHAMGGPTIEYGEGDAVDAAAALRRREVKKQAKAKR